VLRKILIFVVTVSLLLTSNVAYAAGKIFAFNPNPVSSAMGDAGVALTSEFITGNVLNPASAIGIYRTIVTLATSNMTGDIQYNYGGIGFLSDIGVFGATLMYVNYNTDKYYDNIGNSVSGGTSYDLAATFTYALPIKEYLPVFVDYGGFGANLKIMRSSLADYIAETIAIDLGGVISIPTAKNFSFGFALKNLGTSQKFVEKNYELPQMLTLGLAYRNLDFYDLKIALDFTNPKNYENYTSIGFSINPVYFLALRAGLKLGGDSLLNNTRMGVGLQFKGISFDYAFIPSSELNATHSFSLSFAFGKFSDQKTAYEYYLDQHFREAEASFYAKDYPKAREEFDSILAVYPDHQPSQKYLRKIADELAKIDEYTFKKVNKYMKKATEAFDKNNMVKAEKYFRKVLDIDPENNVAQNYIEAIERTTDDIKALQNRDQNKERIQYLWDRYEKFYKKGNIIRARDSLKYLLEIDPENSLAKEKIVLIDNQLAKIASDKANEIYETGMKHYNRGDYEEAILYFEAVLVAAPHRIDVQSLIEKCQQNIQVLTEDERLYKLSQEQDKVRDKLNQEFDDGMNDYQKGRLELAVEHFKKAKILAEKYEFNDYYKKSSAYILRLSAKLSEKYYKQGINAYRSNKFELAAKSYKKALEYNASNTSAAFELERVAGQVAQKYYEEGMTAYSRNEMAKARDCFKRALYYKPNMKEAQRALSRAQ